MAVVNTREWMAEPLLKASIDPSAALEESEGLNVTPGFLSAHKGVAVQVKSSCVVAGVMSARLQTRFIYLRSQSVPISRRVRNDLQSVLLSYLF